MAIQMLEKKGTGPNSTGVGKVKGIAQAAIGAYTGNPAMVAGGLDAMRAQSGGQLSQLNSFAEESPMDRANAMKTRLASLMGGGEQGGAAGGSGLGMLGAMKKRQESMAGFI